MREGLKSSTSAEWLACNSCHVSELPTSYTSLTNLQTYQLANLSTSLLRPLNMHPVNMHPLNMHPTKPLGVLNKGQGISHVRATDIISSKRYQIIKAISDHPKGTPRRNAKPYHGVTRPSRVPSGLRVV